MYLPMKMFVLLVKIIALLVVNSTSKKLVERSLPLLKVFHPLQQTLAPLQYGRHIEPQGPQIRKCFAVTSMITFALFSNQYCLPIAIAQIPMVEDYNFGSGSSKIKLSEKSPEIIYDNVPLVEYIQNCQSQLTTIDDEAKKKLWDDIYKRKPTFKRILKTFFGYESIPALARSNSLSIDRASELESIRENLSFELNQVFDYALSNRVVFFNTEDLKQVTMLKETTNEDASLEEISESVQLISSVNEMTTKIENILKN